MDLSQHDQDIQKEERVPPIIAKLQASVMEELGSITTGAEGQTQPLNLVDLTAPSDSYNIYRSTLKAHLQSSSKHLESLFLPSTTATRTSSVSTRPTSRVQAVDDAIASILQSQHSRAGRHRRETGSGERRRPLSATSTQPMVHALPRVGDEAVCVEDEQAIAHKGTENEDVMREDKLPLGERSLTNVDSLHGEGDYTSTVKRPLSALSLSSTRSAFGARPRSRPRSRRRGRLTASGRSRSRSRSRSLAHLAPDFLIPASSSSLEGQGSVAPPIELRAHVHNPLEKDDHEMVMAQPSKDIADDEPVGSLSAQSQMVPVKDGTDSVPIGIGQGVKVLPMQPYRQPSQSTAHTDVEQHHIVETDQDTVKEQPPRCDTTPTVDQHLQEENERLKAELASVREELQLMKDREEARRRRLEEIRARKSGGASSLPPKAPSTKRTKTGAREEVSESSAALPPPPSDISVSEQQVSQGDGSSKDTEDVDEDETTPTAVDPALERRRAALRKAALRRQEQSKIRQQRARKAKKKEPNKPEKRLAPPLAPATTKSVFKARKVDGPKRKKPSKASSFDDADVFLMYYEDEDGEVMIVE
eukprot:gnl/Dysnectes_brevis/6055_a9109_378.p1 GENE.gnl/Dysnectes_brevis/6055_a9109_378~~gnl/Dysnectes_brevis/6055_a9109_378.p1  ORF type:complete len:588 (+),score=105.90 gnl/Dysnectes_brevis/6055_a9109_378:62-1825(+)